MKQLIKCGWLFDATGTDCLKQNMEILVDGNKISRIEAAGVIREPEATVVDLSDKFVMPGMIDTHVHLQFSAVPGAMGGRSVTWFKTIPEMTIISIKNAETELMHGFTTIRNMGSIGHSDIAVRNSINSGLIKGPRIYACGAPICAAGGHGDTTFRPEIVGGAMGTLINGPYEARAAVRDSFKYGADGIKIACADEIGCPEMQVDEIRAVCEIAHQRGKIVAAHTQGKASVMNALLGGCNTIEHGINMDDECIELMLKNDAYLVPTLAAWRRLAEFYETHPDFPQDQYAMLRQAADSQEENIHRCRAAGVKIAMGSDASTLGNPHGENSYEFQLLSEYGLTTAEALLAGTKVNAEMLRWDDQVGTLEPGKYADIVAFDKSPLEDIKVLRHCTFVMKDGEIFKN